MTQICIVVPEAPAVQSAGAVARRAPSLAGLRVGTLDNAKGNADHLLRFVVEGIRARHPLKAVLTERKATSGSGAPAPVLQKLANEADFVVSAMAD